MAHAGELLDQVLGQALRECYDGRLEPRRLGAMAAGASALVRIVQAGELEERLRRLEQLASEAKQEGRQQE